ncbi:MAG: Flp family type IVb pilin [Terracidiphilus sp.]
MRADVVKLAKSVWKLVVRKDGQDLVEYALIIGLMALAATAGLQTPAQAIYHAFSNDGTTFNTDIGAH